MASAEKFWDFLSKNYDRTEGDPADRQDLEIIHKYLHPDDIVLEYACGTGTLAIQLASRVKAYHGIDISSKMLAAAEQKAASRNIENIHFTHTTIFEAVFPEESFDMALAFNILHLLETARQAVQKINELLKPGGVFISSTPCLGEEKALVNHLLTPFIVVPSRLGIIPYVTFYKISALEDILAQAKFQIVETKRFTEGLTDYLIVARKIGQA
jgi:ubiquinone/menaquinone biosynthesis C-methylase UbiE